MAAWPANGLTDWNTKMLAFLSQFVNTSTGVPLASVFRFSANTDEDADSATLVRDVTYTATSDGFITANGKYANDADVRLNLDVNGNSVAKATLINNNDDGWVGASVASGETFRIEDSTGDPTSLFIFWRSIGTLSKPTK